MDCWKHRNLKILEWNANGIRTKLWEFVNFLFEKNIDVALICETLLMPEISLEIPGYHCIRIDNERPVGGVAIVVRRSLNASELKLPKTTNLELVGIELIGSDANINFIAAYNSPSKTLLVRDLLAITMTRNDDHWWRF